LLAQTRRAQDERPLAPTALLQFGEHERCLDGLAEPNLVGKKEARRAPANERQRRLELKRKNINRRPAGEAKLAMSAQPRKAGLQISHPSFAGDHADFAAGLSEDGTIERVQEGCAPPIAAAARACQTNDDTVVECCGVFDEPSLTTRNNCIACGERQWHVLQ
jgi:hypothetical protein